jgi:hypothetical protein
MIQVAHITMFNPMTLAEEILYVTSSSSFAANGQNYRPCVGTKMSYSENLYSNGATDGSATIGVGNLILDNTDGSLDYLVNYSFDGRTISIYMMPDETGVTDNTTLYFKGIVAHVEPDLSTLTIVLKNRMEELNVAIQSAVFAGTNVGLGAAGGYEGQSGTIGGKTKPMVFGRVMSAEGLPINDYFLIYAFNFDTAGNRKALAAIYNVYVKGVNYYFAGDYANIAALQAATIATGYYATCLTEGVLRLGSVPTSNGSVVADVADGLEANCTAGQTIARVFQTAGYSAGTDYNPSALNILDAKNACPVGYFVTGQDTTATILNGLAASIGAWMIPDSLGVFQFDVIDTTENMLTGVNFDAYASVLTLNKDNIDIANTKRVQTGNKNENIPAKSLTLKHTKVWRTQDSNSLVESVSQTMREFFKNEFRSAHAESSIVGAQHLLAPTIEYDTYLNAPIAANLQNGDFSDDLENVGAGWLFANTNNGTGALQQLGGICQLIPNGGIAYLQQTLQIPADIQVGDWQLMVTLPVGFGGQVIIAQGATGLWNKVYASATSDQDLIIPFTVASGGTQSITLTLQTADSVTNAAFTGVVILQPSVPNAPIYANLVNGNFTSALGTGWTFSNNAGGSGTGVSTNGVCTLTPAGTGTCQISQTISSPNIWPGNWLFGVTVSAGFTAQLTIAQGATILYSGGVFTGLLKALVPFTMLSTGTQSITITIATSSISAVCKVTQAFVCLNHVNLSNYAKFLNQHFTIPFGQVANGWTLSGTGTYSQSLGGATLTPSAGDMTLTQTIAIPADITPGNWIAHVVAGAAGPIRLTILQGNIVLGTMTVALSTTGLLPLTVFSYGASTLTAIISTVSGAPINCSNFVMTTTSPGFYPTYAALINGDFSLSVGTGWTFANYAGGTGSVIFLNDNAKLTPSGTNGCHLDQTISLTAGNYALRITIVAGFSGHVSILNGSTQLFSKACTATAYDQPIECPFSLTGTTSVTIVLATTTSLSKATFKNASLYSLATNSAATFANLVNGTFATDILNLQAGWNFNAVTAGSDAYYSVLNGAITITPGASEGQISQTLMLNNGIFAGAWNLALTLAANCACLVTIYQGVTVIATATFVNVSTVAAQDFSLPFIVGSIAVGANSVTVTIASSGSPTTISGVAATLQTAGLTPQQEAQRRLNMESVLQQRYTVDLPISLGLSVRTGDMVTLQLARFGMDDGLEFLVIGRDDDNDAETVVLDVLNIPSN